MKQVERVMKREYDGHRKYAVSINNVLQNQLSKYFYEDDKFSYNG